LDLGLGDRLEDDLRSDAGRVSHRDADARQISPGSRPRVS
jgi:hypothetical protein